MDLIQNLINTQSTKRNQPEALWSIAVRKFFSLVETKKLGGDQAQQLTLAAKSPRQLLTLVEYLGKALPGDAPATLLVTRVDESSYPLTEWLEAIEAFHDWLSNHSRTTSLPKILGYITCCTEANPNTTSEPLLKDSVTEMLGQYGFDG